MRCEQARRLLSARFDGEQVPGSSLDDHLHGCAACTSFQTEIARVRSHLRLQSLEEVPDVLPAVLSSIGERKSRGGWLVPAAAFGVGVVISATIFGARGLSPVLAMPIHERVATAQNSVRSFSAQFELIEYGYHPQVPERKFAGNIIYTAPETMWLRLTDTTTYPNPAWRANDVELVVKGITAWSRARPDCPRLSLPGCLSPQATLELVAGRDPFSPTPSAPLDLVVPASSLRFDAEHQRIDLAEPSGRPAVGLEISAAQATPLLEAVIGLGSWREIHPTDRVHLWLDPEFLVPLSFIVYPAATPDRQTWAARRGYDDPADRPTFEFRIQEWSINQAAKTVLPGIPEEAAGRDLGFRPHGLTQLVDPPEGFDLAGSGTIESFVQVWAWSDGRAWIRLDLRPPWTEPYHPLRVQPGLFGREGRTVRPLAGVGIYTDGTAVFVHGAKGDAVLRGSVPFKVLEDLAGSLHLGNQPVPENWPEAQAETIAQAAVGHPGLLIVPSPPGFAAPVVAKTGEAVVLDYIGSGERRFRLVERPGSNISPPIDPDARTVGLRGLVARFSPGLSELEWVENGIVLSLSSHSLDLGELVRLAESLRGP
jgi:hypothetical protein